MWESLTIICIILAIICIVFCILYGLMAIGISKFLEKNKEKLLNPESQAMNSFVDTIIKELANTHVILKIVLSIGFIRNVIKSIIKKNIGKELVKAIKSIRNSLIMLAASQIFIFVMLIAIANSFYTLQLSSNAAVTVLQMMLMTEDTEIEEEEAGWEWESEVTDKTVGETSDSSNNRPGHATGRYSIELDDGSYYWYHQSTDACEYDATQGDIRTSTLKTGKNLGTMAARGCSTYSTAIALSNLLGQEITPIVVIEKVLGCEIKESGSGTYYFSTKDTGSGVQFNFSGVNVTKATLASNIEDAYGNLGVHAQAITVKNNQAGVDEILNKGGYIITSFNKSFPWYYRNSSGSHYIVIRKKENGLYYCFNSCGGASRDGHNRNGHDGAIDSMTTGATWEELNSAFTHSDGCAVWGEGIIYETSGGNTSGGGGSISVGINTNVYEVLSASQEFKAKAKTLAMVYATAAPKFGHNFALGLMANVQHEGDFGTVEGMWTSSSETGKKAYKLNCSCSASGKYTYYYWPKVSCQLHTQLYNKSKQINNELYTLLRQIPSGVEGVGVGIIQWSGSRRVQLLNLYAQSGCNWTQESIAAIEIGMMVNELQDSYNKVPQSCLRKSPEACAEAIVRGYEKPGDLEGAVTRRSATASKLAQLLGSE